VVGVRQREPVALCTKKVTATLICPRYKAADYSACDAHEPGGAMTRLFGPDEPHASAFTEAFIGSHRAFAEIVVDFMVPEWRAAERGAVPRGGLARSAPEKEKKPWRFFQWRIGGSAPAPRNNPPGPTVSPPTPPDSVLEVADQLRENARPPSPQREAQGRRTPPAASRIPLADGHVGDLRILDWRGTSRVEWHSPGSRAARPPLDVRWHRHNDGGRILLGAQSVGAGHVVYGTRLRHAPGEEDILDLEEMVTALHLADGRIRWRWRNVSLACTPQIHDEVVLLRREETLWAVDLHTGRVRWTVDTPGAHAEEAGISHGRAIFHAGPRFQAVDLRTGRTAWEVKASRHAPRPMTGTSLVVLAGEEGIRAVTSSTGQDAWRVPGLGAENRVPAVTRDHVIFWTWDGVLHAVETVTGRRAWTLRSNAGYPGDDPLAHHGVVLYRDGELGDAVLCAVDEERGRPLWQVPMEETLSGNVGVRRNQVFVATSHNEMTVLELETGRLLWRLFTPIAGMRATEDVVLLWNSGRVVCLEE